MSSRLCRLLIITRRDIAVLMATLVILTGVQSAVAADVKAFGQFAPDATIEMDHSVFDDLLTRYVKTAEEGRTIFAYGDVTDDDKTALKTYIDSLEAIDPTTLTKAQAYAYWVNMYNAVTVDLILDNYPLKSIRSLGLIGPWGRELVTVNGQDLSLNNMEHDILRVFWRDPRTHYAVNCASFGCPNLQPTAFTAANTDMVLNQGAADYVNHPRGITVDSRGRVIASSIYKWYKKDFGENDAEILDHIRQYATPELRAKLDGKKRINKYAYDWALNEK
ncbi:MAG: DUF547 domain-containing protein [Pseudomonadota bacterium]